MNREAAITAATILMLAYLAMLVVIMVSDTLSAVGVG